MNIYVEDGKFFVEKSVGIQWYKIKDDYYQLTFQLLGMDCFVLVKHKMGSNEGEYWELGVKDLNGTWSGFVQKVILEKRPSLPLKVYGIYNVFDPKNWGV